MPRTFHRIVQSLFRLYPFPRGQGRILDHLPLESFRFEEEALSVRTCDGFVITVFPNDHIGRHLYYTGQFDRTVIQVILSFCREGDCLLDIGANIGYVSCSVLHAIGDSTVVAIEPVGECYRLLSQNLLRSGHGRAVAINTAVSVESGTAFMVLKEGNLGASAIANDVGMHADDAWRTVKVMNGRDLMEVCRKVDVIKIDVEGHEAQVISGLLPLIERDRPRAIVFEHHTGFDAEKSTLWSDLASVGYDVHAVRRTMKKWWLVSAHDRGALRSRDYVALPREEQPARIATRAR